MKYSNSPRDLEHLREILGEALELVHGVSVVLRDGKVVHGTVTKICSDHTNEENGTLWNYGGEITVATVDGHILTLDCQDIKCVGINKLAQAR